jgi:hypothetical protein
VRNRTLLNVIGLGSNFLRVLRGDLNVSSTGLKDFFDFFSYNFFLFFSFGGWYGLGFVGCSEVLVFRGFLGDWGLYPSNAGSLYLYVISYIPEKLTTLVNSG